MKPEQETDPLDTLACLLVEGKARITRITVNACGRCKAGTYRSSPTPDWMNRWVCDQCGEELSR